ncbi:MAG: signal recognition particle receptor subunit alpha, partial [Tidjanibacter sp.]|nr:signal recognition particle receptor subunit alpha [Tidjanibacter sp.]
FTGENEEFFDELEETLILADAGVDTATDAVERLREVEQSDSSPQSAPSPRSAASISRVSCTAHLMLFSRIRGWVLISASSRCEPSFLVSANDMPKAKKATIRIVANRVTSVADIITEIYNITFKLFLQRFCAKVVNLHQ